MPTWLIWLLVLAVVIFATKGLLTAISRRSGASRRAGRRSSSTTGDSSTVPIGLDTPHHAGRTTREGDGHGQDSPSSDSGSSDGGGDGGGGGD